MAADSRDEDSCAIGDASGVDEGESPDPVVGAIVESGEPTIWSTGAARTGAASSAAPGQIAPTDAVPDAVQVSVRPGEIVIAIRGTALLAGDGGPATETGASPSALRTVESIGARASARAGRGPTAVASRSAERSGVGVREVVADKLRHGYRNFWIRADLVDSYLAAYRQVRALGGVITSSGGLRALSAGATAGRSRTSLHYTGRAIDLFTESGMQGDSEERMEPYVVVRDGGTDAHPLWKVYCAAIEPNVSDAAYDSSLIEEGPLDGVRWKRGAGAVPHRRVLRYFCLTDVFGRHGWTRIPARADWRDQYLSCEWWHFQHHRGLTVGVSTFGEQLTQVWPADRVRASGLDLDAVWAGRSFSGRARPPLPPSRPEPDPREKVEWAQTVLNAVSGEALATDGAFGPRTAAALRRFQTRSRLAASGVLDATTEVALIQRALERVEGIELPRIGVLDAATVDAIKRFQHGRGLQDDGRVGEKTRAAMVLALLAATRADAHARGVAPAPLETGS